MHTTLGEMLYFFLVVGGVIGTRAGVEGESQLREGLGGGPQTHALHPQLGGEVSLSGLLATRV